MYPTPTRAEALRRLSEGASISTCARQLGVARSTVRSWRDNALRGRPPECPRCDGSSLDSQAYAALLGYYLGDGHISRAPRYYVLRVTCDLAHPTIIEDLIALAGRVRPGHSPHLVTRVGCIVVQANWKHWPCLFPQHGPGPKHARSIVLEEWQRTIVESYPADFLRGLFHSDGSRVANRVRRLVAGEMKYYLYPRWQFTNYSADIRELCCWALDLVDVPWRQSNLHHISVSTRAGVARLDGLIGLKQ